MLQALAKNFLRGLLFVVPVAATVYVIYMVVVTVDGWINVEPFLDRPIPGAGFVLTIVAITLTGFLASNIATRWLFRVMDLIFRRVPLVKLLYTSIKDLIGAFVGEKKRFDRPVLVSLGDGVDTSVLGFLTREDLSEFGIPGHVAVYFPQAYNFAGNLLVVPKRRVRAVHADSATVMTLIVSGGVSGGKEKTPPASHGPLPKAGAGARPAQGRPDPDRGR